MSAVILLGSAGSAIAQQTIFNVPTADILDRGKVYFELDMSFKPNDQRALRKFSSFIPRLVFGTGHNVEIGLNLNGNIQPGVDSTTVVPAVKWRFYQNKKKDLALFAGNNIYIPVRNRPYRIGSYSYAAISKTISGKTRLTAGGYLASKNVFAPNAVRSGGQFGLEQTVTAKLNINADWFTGKHAYGYFTTGAAYRLTKKFITVGSYSFGNANLSKGNHYLYLQVGYNFN